MYKDICIMYAEIDTEMLIYLAQVNNIIVCLL